jgi:hypothetical protein
MTVEELAKLKIHDVSSHIRPRAFYVEAIDAELRIPDYYDLNEIFKAIYEEGFKLGTTHGEEMKILEIKKVLDI